MPIKTSSYPANFIKIKTVKPGKSIKRYVKHVSVGKVASAKVNAGQCFHPVSRLF